MKWRAQIGGKKVWQILLSPMILITLLFTAQPTYAQTTDNFSLSVFYEDNNGSTTNTPQCVGSTNLDSAKRHGWLYAGYLFHIFLEGQDPGQVAQTNTAGQDNLFGLAECDDSFCYMQRTFGYMPGIFYVDGTPGCGYSTATMNGQATVLSNLMRLLNYGLFSVLMIVTGYAIIQGVLLGAMHEGSILNQRLTLLASTRICVGAFLLVPQVGTGYSSIQIILMYFIMLGVGLADRAFSSAVNNFITNGYVFSQGISAQQEASDNQQQFLADALQAAFKDNQTGSATNPISNPNTYPNLMQSWQNNNTSASTVNIESNVDIMRRILCAQYQVYSRILRTNDPNYSLSDGLGSVQINLQDIATITNNGNGTTTVAFGDRSDSDGDYYNWCGWVVYPTEMNASGGVGSQIADIAYDVLDELNTDVWMMFQNAITTMQNYRTQDYDASNEDMMAQYYTCLKQQNVTIESATAQASLNPTCSESSEWQQGESPYTSVVVYPCADDPNNQPNWVGAGNVGTLQGAVLGTWDTQKIPWMYCNNLGLTTTLNNKNYASCIEQVASNLSAFFAQKTNNYNPCKTNGTNCSSWSANQTAKTYMFVTGQNAPKASTLRSMSITSNTAIADTEPSCYNPNSAPPTSYQQSCYQYDIYQIGNADDSNGTSYTGNQWDLITAYRFFSWALANAQDFGNTGTAFNNIYSSFHDYNTYVETASTNPQSSVSSSDGQPSKLDTVTYSLLNPIYNGLPGVFAPKQGFLISSSLSPSTFNLTQSIMMILEKFYGFRWFNNKDYPSNDSDNQYFQNFWNHASDISALGDDCTGTFNAHCPGEGCFDAMASGSSPCITQGGLLGAANVIQTGTTNYNPFSDFILMGRTIMLATSYYIIYNNIDLFIVNCISTAVYFSLEAAISMITAVLKVVWSQVGPDWLKQLATSFGTAAYDMISIYKELDLSLVQYYTGICDSLIFLALPMGFMMGILIPFYPILIFVTAAFGWFVSVFEAMIAAPLVAVGLAHPAYHDVMGKSTQSVLLIFSVFLQPIMLVFGVFFSITVLNVMIIFFNTGYVYYLSDLLTKLYVGLSTEVIILVSIGLVYIYMMLMWEVISKSCQVMVMINDRVMRWMDSNWQAQASGAMAEKLIGAAKDATSGMASAVQSGAQGTMQNMAKGRQQLSEAAFNLGKTMGGVAMKTIESYRAEEGEKVDWSDYDDKDGLSIGDIASQHQAATSLRPAVTKNLLQGRQDKIDIEAKHGLAKKRQGVKDAEEIAGALAVVHEARKDKDPKRLFDSDYKDAKKLLEDRGISASDGKYIDKKTNREIEVKDGKATVTVTDKDGKETKVDLVKDARNTMQTAANEAAREMRSIEANRDPRSVQDMTGPGGPKTKMTVGELNTKIVDIQAQLKNDPNAKIAINSKDDMIAARAAGVGWDKIMQGYGKNGTTADKALTDKRFMSMMGEAAKVKVNTNAGNERAANNALDRFNNNGEKAASNEIANAFKGALSDGKGGVDQAKLKTIMESSLGAGKSAGTSKQTAAILQKIGVGTKDIADVAKASSNPNMSRDFMNLRTLVQAGYSVNEIDSLKLVNPAKTPSVNIPFMGQITGKAKAYTSDDISLEIVRHHTRAATQQVSIGGRRVSYDVGGSQTPSLVMNYMFNQKDPLKEKLKSLGVSGKQYIRSVNKIKLEDKARGK